MVRPSKREKRIAGLRELAIGKGLQVRLSSRLKLPQELSRLDCACYLLNRKSDAEGKVGSGFRDMENGKIRCYGSLAGLEDRIKAHFEQLPEGAEAFVVSETFVGVCWDEKGDQASIEQIMDQLPNILELTQVKIH